MALNFGQHEDVVFDHAPLVNVICQVKFPPVLSLLAAAGVAGFQAGLRDEYQVLLEPEQLATVRLGPDAAVGLETSAPTWRLKDQAGNWIVSIAANFVALETSHYSDIGDFLGRLKRILEVLRRTVRPADSLRVGLRKINMIDFPQTSEPQGLIGVIRPEVLGVLAVPEFPAPVSAGWSFLQFTEDENTLAIHYGLQLKETFSFVLDMDYSTSRPYAVDGHAEMLELLRHYSDGMTSFFHYAIDEKYQGKLVPHLRSSQKSKS